LQQVESIRWLLEWKSRRSLSIKEARYGKIPEGNVDTSFT
jgi:hypothetical protein